MPKKIRELEARLKKAGFVWESGKGSHRKWKHSLGVTVMMSGGSGDDAKRYQEQQVAAAILAVQEKSKQN